VTRSDAPGAPVNFAPVADAFGAELEAFVSAIDGDGSLVRSTLDDALGAQRIIEAAARSIETGRRVDVADSDG
jgi:predicted dehydrogenase